MNAVSSPRVLDMTESEVERRKREVIAFSSPYAYAYMVPQRDRKPNPGTEKIAQSPEG